MVNPKTAWEVMSGHDAENCSCANCVASKKARDNLKKSAEEIGREVEKKIGEIFMAGKFKR
jgi:hypothetical protein